MLELRLLLLIRLGAFHRVSEVAKYARARYLRPLVQVGGQMCSRMLVYHCHGQHWFCVSDRTRWKLEQCI